MRRRAHELKDAFRSLGPAFVKIGQALSSRPDLLPKVDMHPLSFSGARSIRLKDLVLTYLDPSPFLPSQPYLEVLSELQDRLPPFPSQIARQLIKEELGREVEEVFSEFR